MAKPPPLPRADSGVDVRTAPPRRFPWRLWLYAILMTGAAGAAGYFAWNYRAQKGDAESKLDKQTPELAKKTTDLAECQTLLGSAGAKSQALQKQVEESSKSLHASAAELETLRQQKAESDKRAAAIEDLQKQFAKMVDMGQLRVSARRGELVLSLPSEVLFPSGSSELSKQGEYAVVEVAAVLKHLPDRRFLVVGHTDNQDYAKPKDGSAAAAACVPKDNWQLSTERALTVTRVLVTAGMKQENLLAAGVGDHDPIASNTTADGRQKNRRIEIALLPAINELPPLPASVKEDPAPAPGPKGSGSP